MENNNSELAKGMEHLTKFLNGLNIEDLPNNFDIYRQKYLKYKTKYLELKRLMK